ncbi:c-type cytochrome [Thalassobacillus devorans]|uniref:c-type cytochrome n=1 Tax=Thalassobacillus devorans TaxID=279813 RepID=UPI000A1C8572|nr:c-type cytochrome [Thalassobacillus devorans]
MWKNKWLIALLLLIIAAFAACSNNSESEFDTPNHYESTLGELDPDDPMTEEIRYGEKLMYNTNTMLADEVGNELSCTSCHANGGISNTNSFMGVAGQFPVYRPRSDTIFTLEDRVNGCMQRSMNGKKLDHDSREMRAMVAYMTYLSEGAEQHGDDMEGLQTPTFDKTPEPDVARGEELYETKGCITCHGADGAGRSPNSGPALWGDGSFNDGAGMGRLSKAAGYIQANMPKGDENTLTKQEAADLAAYVLSHDRPVWDDHENDWPNGDGPPDIITQERREQIRAGTFDWSEIENVVPKD